MLHMAQDERKTSCGENVQVQSVAVFAPGSTRVCVAMRTCMRIKSTGKSDLKCKGTAMKYEKYKYIFIRQ